jgi:hypothetical protein
MHIKITVVLMFLFGVAMGAVAAYAHHFVQNLR